MSDGLIIIVIIGYAIMWLSTGILVYSKLFDFDEALISSFLGIFWPITLPVVMATCIIQSIGDLILWRGAMKERARRAQK